MAYCETIVIFVVTLLIPSLYCADSNVRNDRKVSPSDPIIDTVNGPVRGILDTLNNTKISKFYGIPYALPPIGQLRFKKSRQLNYSWTEPLIAFDQPNFCFQAVNIALTKEVGKGTKGIVSEDCLYLNIFAPGLTGANKNDKTKELKPVMIWVHGGNFYGGSISQPMYEAKVLAAKGDVVVVPINYRTGAFGYLYTGSSEEDAPGNQALWDLLNAVYWVSRNIKNFGGDPAKITLVGHGSGAVLISMAAISPAFDQILVSFIIMSGPALGKWIEPKSISKIRAKRLAYQMGCASEGHLFEECFKNVDPHLLAVASQFKTISPIFDSRVYSYFNILPQYGESLVPMNPVELVKFYPKTKRVMLGATDFEGSPLLQQKEILIIDPRILRITNSDKASTWKSGFKDMINRDIIKVNETTRQKIVDYYFEQSALKTNKSKERTSWGYDVLQFWGDHNIVCPLTIQADMMAENLNDVFFYRFSHSNNVTTSITACKGYNLSCHGTEIPLLFGMPFSDPNSFDDSDRAASTELIEIFAGFMRGDNKFPKITASDRGAYTFGPNVSQVNKITYDWNRGICNLYKPYILIDDELDEKAAADTIWMQMIQSPFGVPARYLNKMAGYGMSYSDKIGYYFLPMGRRLADWYNVLANYLNTAPSPSEFVHKVSSYTGVTRMF